MKIPSEKRSSGYSVKVSSKVSGAKHKLEMTETELQESRFSNALPVLVTAEGGQRDIVHTSRTSWYTTVCTHLGLHRVIKNVFINAVVEYSFPEHLLCASPT